MKISLLLLCFPLLIACSSSARQGLPNDFTIRQFDSLNDSDQAKFINTLNKKAKMKFMSLLLRGRSFDVPPTSNVRFYSDGEFIVDYELEDESKRDPNKFLLGHWRYVNDRIILEQNNPDIQICGKKEIWDDVWVEKGDEKDGVLTIHVEGGIDNDGKPMSPHLTGLSGNHPDRPGEKISPAIDAYNKLKAQNKVPVPVGTDKR